MTKNIIKSVSAAVLLTALLTGCSDKEPKPVDEGVDFQCRQDGVLAPDFTCNPFADGFVTALGVQK